jgi:GR25 family glycosyltransferase involved in LPS biosynthesis
MQSTFATYILSIKDSLSYSHLISELNNSGFSPRIFTGCQPESLDLRLYSIHNETHVKKFGRRITPTEYCCAKSHYMIWKDVAQSNKSALILEDDAIISNYSALMSSLLNWTDAGTHSIFYLGGMDGWEDKKNRLILRRDKICQEIGASGYLSKYLAAFLVRTVSYAITPTAAKALVLLFDQSPFVEDRWDYILASDKTLKIYYSELVRHPLIFTSTIEKPIEPNNYTRKEISPFPTLKDRVIGFIWRRIIIIASKPLGWYSRLN